MQSKSDSLLHQLHQCTNLVHRRGHQLRQVEQDEGVFFRGQARLLGALLENDGLSQKELVEVLDIRPSSVGELVVKLEQNGYVERRQNEQDRRIINVYLTDDGRKLATSAAEKRDSFLEDLFSGLTPEETDQLSALLNKLSDSLQEKLGEDAADDPFGRCGGHRGHHHHPSHRGAHGPEGFGDHRNRSHGCHGYGSFRGFK